MGRYAQPQEVGLNRKNNAFFGSNYGATWDLQRGNFRGYELRARRSRAEATKILVLQCFQSKILQCPSAAGLEDLQNFKCTDGRDSQVLQRTHTPCVGSVLPAVQRFWPFLNAIEHDLSETLMLWMSTRSVSITCHQASHCDMDYLLPSPPPHITNTHHTTIS